VAEADEKVIAPPSAAQRQQEQPYAEPEERRPPYFGEREPTAWSATTHFRGESSFPADANRSHLLLLDGPPPLTGEEWLRIAVERMKARPDCPYEITQAAQRFEAEMYEAFLRRQCTEAWAWGSIKNHVLKQKLWPRRRRPRRAR
jgi:hypothetical protein